MKIYFTALKLISSATFVILLANCASSSQDSSESIDDETRIIITGSRIKRTEVEAISSIVRVISREERKKVKKEHGLALRVPNSAPPFIENELLYKRIANNPIASNQIFKRYKVNPTIQTIHNPVSTFSMDADNGSYKLASAMLNRNQLPNPDGIRIEEFINSMDYQYNQSEGLFSVSAEAMPSPFRDGYHVLHLGLQTKTLADHERNPSNLVFVADISGSMASDNKIDLLKNAMTTLVSQLNKDDYIALVVYNDNASVVLEPTPVANKRKIFKVINNLQTGGSTNAERGLIKGYEIAEQMYQPGFNNRVILTSDGMANVGSVSPESIIAKISESKDKGIFLTTLGVGIGMYNDHLLEQLANKGNGNYLYIANQKDIQNAFVDGLNSQLQTVAKDAKIQVTFDPQFVSNYRLLGYENRQLKKQDFTDANKDGGEVGAGHKVTALYEIKLKKNSHNHQTVKSGSIAKISIAYKKPQGHKVQIMTKNIPYNIIRGSSSTVSPDSRLSFAVAAFAEKLRQSYWSRLYNYEDIDSLLSHLPNNYKRQQQVIDLRKLVTKARQIDSRIDTYEVDYPVANINYDRVPLLD